MPCLASQEETPQELYWRIRAELESEREKSPDAGAFPRAVLGPGPLRVGELVHWLRARVSAEVYGLCERGDVLADQVLDELAIVSKRMGGVDTDCVNCLHCVSVNTRLSSPQPPAQTG